MLDRRRFIASLAALPAAAAGEERRNQQPGMAYRKLGRTGYVISEFVMGGNTIAPNNYEHVLRALDMGLNYLDTAPAYGRGLSEQGYAHVIKSRPRDKFFLNSKVSLWDINRNRLYKQMFDSLSASEQARLTSAAKEEIERRKADAPEYFGSYFPGQRDELDAAALSNVMEKKYGRTIDRGKNYRQLILDSVDESLKRLGTDHLDLLMCPHGANTPHELVSHPEIFEAFETLRKAGKVRHLGVSAHTDPAGILEAAVKAKVYSAAMVAYSIMNHPYMFEALEQAKRNDLGVIAMKVARPVFSGRPDRPANAARTKLIEQAVPGKLKVPQKAYVWALRNPNLTAVISELVNTEMVKENLPLAGGRTAA